MGNKLYVGNLAYSVRDEIACKSHLRQFGYGDFCKGDDGP